MDDVMPTIPTALGPGDADPRSPVVVVAAPIAPVVAPIEIEPPVIPSALGPGASDPRSPARGTAAPIAEVLKPGDSVGENPDDAFHFLAPPPAGPGGVDRGALHLPRIPKRREPAARAADEEST